MSLPHPGHDTARARALILRHGWNTTSYQLLNPGFTFWFSEKHDAMVAYIRAARTRVVGGAPVCSNEILPEVVAEFEHATQQANERVCYFAAEQRLETVLRESSKHTRIQLGALPVWDPRGWAEIVRHHTSIRAQCNRARNKGVVVSRWSSDRINSQQNNHALDTILHQWLKTRGLPPLHFLVEPNTLATLDDRVVFVAEHNRTQIGFLVASPIATRNGWLVEQFVRAPNAPNGTVELMLDTAIQWMNSIGATYTTLGLSPLSSRAGSITSPTDPLWLRVAFYWARAHGRRFYNFDGLDAFKAKFNPIRWEPVYAITTETHASPKTLFAIAAAFTEGRPGAFVLRTIGRVIAHPSANHTLIDRQKHLSINKTNVKTVKKH